MYFGGDYNPEQWPEHVWDDDMALMRDAGVNLVSVGIFSWATLNPAEGEFEFGWLDRILDKLHANGIGVGLATATASPPAWLVRSYPDVLPVTADGVRLEFGSRQHYAPTSPDYRRLAAELVSRIAERYVDHPAVRMWHVGNEFACHIRADYSEHATRSFREWLRTKYRDIETLNDAWGTSFWSQRYTDFGQVNAPRTAPTILNGSTLLDFRRFTSDSTLELFCMERDILRRHGATQPIVTNFMGFFPALDYRKWSREVDIVTDDNYPDPRDPEAFREAAMTRDLMRSLKPGTPWILMEQTSNLTQWRPNNAPKRPGQMAAWSQQAIARGADGILFFQWRQSRGGQEKFHSAMVPHAGTDTRVWAEVRELGRAIGGLDNARPPRGQVAIIVDWENWWALDQPDLPADTDYLAELRTWYRALHRDNIQTSFVHPEDDLTPFDLVIAPALYLLTSAGAASLRSFVEAGGVLVTSAFTDVVDENDQFRDGGFGTQLVDVLGGQPVEFFGLEDVDGYEIHFSDGVVARPKTLFEEFRVDTAHILARTHDGQPALVRNDYGRGASLHLAAFPDDVLAALVTRLGADEAGVVPVVEALDPRVEAIATEQGVTLINQATSAVEVRTGCDVVTLRPFEVRRIVGVTSNAG